MTTSARGGGARGLGRAEPAPGQSPSLREGLPLRQPLQRTSQINRVRNNIVSDCPEQYCPSPVPHNIVSDPSRVVFTSLSSRAPKHAREGGSSAALGPVANAQPTQGRRSPGAVHHRMLVISSDQHPVRWTPGGRAAAPTNKHKDHGDTASTSAPPPDSVQCSVQKRSLVRRPSLTSSPGH